MLVVHKVPPDPKVKLVLRDRKVTKELPDHRDRLDHRDQLDLKEKLGVLV